MRTKDIIIDNLEEDIVAWERWLNEDKNGTEEGDGGKENDDTE